MKLDLSPLVRFIGHLPKSGDQELALLKCHLLIEEVLTKLVERSLRHPELLPKVRLSFAQKIWLSRSVTNLEEESWAWDALQRLNEARNQLAHGLATEALNGKLEEFIRVVERKEGPPEPGIVGGVLGRFQWAAFHVYIFFAVHAHFDPASVRIPTVLTGGATSALSQGQVNAGGKDGEG
jgi:hypothetical protein